MTAAIPRHVTVGSSGPDGPTKGLLRFLTCGSVDDGKSTLIGRLLYDTKLILEDQLVALARDSRKHGTTGRGHRLRAAGRRARSRARAGHHHRRGVPVLQHAAPLVHRGGYAGARAVHAQHGHGRVELRRRGHSHRCAQGRAHADAAAQLHLLAARHPARRGGGEQDRSRRVLGRALPSHHGRLLRVRAVAGLRVDHADPAVGALRRQRHGALGAHALVRRPDAARLSRERRRRAGARARSRSASRCSG